MQRKLTLTEITAALGVGSEDFGRTSQGSSSGNSSSGGPSSGGGLPPILTPPEAAGLLRLKVSTLYRHVSEGRYSGAVKRGKPLRFWRDRLIQEFMR